MGIDRSAEAVGTAHRRAVAAGRDWVRFGVAELDAYDADEKFDAMVGRLVLMYFTHPATTLRRLHRYLRPGGVVALQEMAMPLCRSTPEGAALHGILLARYYGSRTVATSKKLRKTDLSCQHSSE